MKSILRLFFISLIAVYTLIIYSCNNNDTPDDQSSLPVNGGPLLNIKTKTVNFSVTQIPCQTCVNAIKRKLLDIDGISSVEVVLGRLENNVSVSYAPAKVTLDKIKAAFKEIGKTATVYSEI